MHKDTVELIYQTLNGLYRPGCGIKGVENAFAPGSPCSTLYAQAYDAYQRLCDRLGVVDEDDDVEIIFDAFSDICRLMGLKMYHYGCQFGNREEALEFIG